MINATVYILYYSLKLKLELCAQIPTSLMHVNDNSPVFFWGGVFLHHCPFPGFKYHRHMHGDANAGCPAEDFSWEHTREDFFLVRQASGLLQEEK